MLSRSIIARFAIPLFAALALVPAPASRAGYFNPASFTSSGTLNLAPGDYTINTDGAPTLLDASNNVLFTGTTISQGGGFRDIVSVLTFDSITVGLGVNIRVRGENPLALLSKSNVLMRGVIDASGFKGADSARFGGSGLGGAGGPGAGAGGNGAGGAGFGPGGGPAGPFGIGAVQAAGGSFGGKGGDSAFGTVGTTYGNLFGFLEGGSGGGATGGSFFDQGNGAGGGGGGGAVELGALGVIDFEGGDLIANGGGVGGAFAANAGGGSGGGLRIHAPTIFVRGNTDITATGGPFWGGGGRILFLTSTGEIVQTGGNIAAGVGGGANNPTEGTIDYGTLSAVPEPSTFALFAVGGISLFALSRRKR
ncbi:MAG: PEP-CTERM sorting domain-containing protein [Isosphaeraceae bacterium]|nr:PEP-CTERM sorting domain-containing protein [Isosphaeraceae bacterium]